MRDIWQDLHYRVRMHLDAQAFNEAVKLFGGLPKDMSGADYRQFQVNLRYGHGEAESDPQKQENKQLALWIKLIATYNRVGDAVFVDQRGNSERGEILRFKYRTQEEPLDSGASIARSTAGFVETARAAVAEFAAKGIDLRGYTVKECAD